MIRPLGILRSLPFVAGQDAGNSVTRNIDMPRTISCNAYSERPLLGGAGGRVIDERVDSGPRGAVICAAVIVGFGRLIDDGDIAIPITLINYSCNRSVHSIRRDEQLTLGITCQSFDAGSGGCIEDGAPSS